MSTAHAQWSPKRRKVRRTAAWISNRRSAGRPADVAIQTPRQPSGGAHARIIDREAGQ